MLLSAPRGCRAGWQHPSCPGLPRRLVEWAGSPPYLCTCRTKACTSWIRGSWLSGLALERDVDLP